MNISARRTRLAIALSLGMCALVTQGRADELDGSALTAGPDAGKGPPLSALPWLLAQDQDPFWRAGKGEVVAAIGEAGSGSSSGDSGVSGAAPAGPVGAGSPGGAGADPGGNPGGDPGGGGNGAHG